MTTILYPTLMHSNKGGLETDENGNYKAFYYNKFYQDAECTIPADKDGDPIAAMMSSCGTKRMLAGSAPIFRGVEL